MEKEQEIIKEQMEETRSALTEKIGILEQQVVDTVQEAKDGVKETVTVLKDAVQDTVQTVKDTVGETVDNVKETFDLSIQMQRRPWVVMGGAIALGFAGGYLCCPPNEIPRAAKRQRPHRERTGNGSHKSEPLQAKSPEPAAGMLGHLGDALHDQIDQLKGLAIGTLAAVVRDLVTTTLPDVLKGSVADTFNEMTVKLGGQPIRERIIPEPSCAGAGDERSGNEWKASEFRHRMGNPM
jgi:hypothetical protein